MAKYEVELIYARSFRQPPFYSQKDATDYAKNIIEFGNPLIKQINVIKIGKKETILSKFFRKKEDKMDEQEDYILSAQAIIDGE